MQNPIPPISGSDPVRRIELNKDTHKKREDEGTTFSLEDQEEEPPKPAPTATEHAPIAPSEKNEPGGRLDVTG